MNQHSSEESPLNSQVEDCIQDCLNSHAVCLDTAMSLLQKGNNYANTVRILPGSVRSAERSARAKV